MGIFGPRSFLRGDISGARSFLGMYLGPRSIPGGRYTKVVRYRGEVGIPKGLGIPDTYPPY